MFRLVRILKKRAREISCSGKVLKTFEFLRIFGPAEKCQGAADFMFCQEIKNSNFDNFFPELDKNPPTCS